MKIGVSSYSFSRLYKDGGFSLFDAIQYAGKTGFDAIEFTDLVPPPGESVTDYAKEIAGACARLGLSICSYTIGADFINGSGGDIAKETARVKACVDVAKILGVPSMRHDSCWGFKESANGRRTYRDAIAIIAPAIREVSDYAEALGIRTMTENHGYFMQDSYRIEELVLAVGRRNYGILVDMGNFMCADEISVAALARVMPYAFHVHAKDFLWKSGAEPAPDDSWFPTRGGNHLRGTIVGHGVVSAAQCLRYIKGSGYDGTISLEFEGPEEPLDAIRRGYEFIRNHVQ
jgi:sugar phosphate isomerase/epimerase